MRVPFRNPALEWFVRQITSEIVLAQVLIRHADRGWELRHVEDRHESTDRLRLMPFEEARAIAQFTEAGVFRPLKSAPTLKRGWKILCASESDFELAMNALYPEAIADLYATREGSPPVTNYREFTNRQTGMYRITTFLNDPDAALVIGRCCAPDSCLKRRLWTVEGLAPDPAPTKSIIPCLEPCAILLEYARKIVRAIQQEQVPVATLIRKVSPE